MDETEILSRLDARGTAAGTAVADAVAATPVPTFDPHVLRVALDAPPRRGRRRWATVAGVAAAVLAAAGVVGVVGVGDGDPDGAPADHVQQVGPPRRWITDAVPAGLVPAGATTDAGASGAALSGPALLLGPADDRLVLTVAVLAESDDAEEEEDISGFGVVDVGRGREAWRVDGAEWGPHGRVLQLDGRYVLVAGQDQAAVDAVASAVEVDGDRADVDAVELPEGWEVRGELDDLSQAASPTFLARGGAPEGVAATATYADGEDRWMFVSSASGGELDVQATRVVASSVEEVEVRGRTALLAELGTIEEGMAPSRALVWQERPGEVVRIGGVGVSAEDLLAAAAALRQPTDDEWERLRMEAARPDPGDGTLVVGGRFSDGTPWALVGQQGQEVDEAGNPAGPAEPWLSLETDVDNSTATDVTWSSAALPLVYLGQAEAVSWVHGAARQDVATVALVDRDGRQLAVAEVASEGIWRGWVLEVPAGLVDIRTSTEEGSSASSGGGSGIGGVDHGLVLVSRAADGTELERRPLP